MGRKAIVLAIILFFLPSAGRAGEVTQEDVQHALVSYLEQNAPVGVEMVEWKFQHRSPVTLKGKILNVEGPLDSRWRAQTPLKIKVEDNSGSSQVFWITLKLVYSRGVVVANRNLPMGHRISRQDVSIEIREGWRFLNEDYSRAEDILGKGIWRPVSKGTTIKNFHIKQGENIQRGDAVMIIAEKGALRIEAPGKVLETGKPGEMIRVINTLSGKELFAQIIDAQTVSVPF